MAAGERLLVPFDLELKNRLYAVSFYFTSKLLDEHSEDSIIKISLGGLTQAISTHV